MLIRWIVGVLSFVFVAWLLLVAVAPDAGTQQIAAGRALAFATAVLFVGWVAAGVRLASLRRARRVGR